MMNTGINEREHQILSFLEQCGLEHAGRQRIAGDASFRRYERILPAGRPSLILMDAPPDKEDICPFLNIQRCLKSARYSVPEIVEQDVIHGFILLEDLGDVSFTSAIHQTSGEEENLYLAATDVLVELAGVGPDITRQAEDAVRVYTYEELIREAALLGEWFLPLIMEPERAAEEGDAFLKALSEVLHRIDITPQVLVHRDYHADNLFWLPERGGVQRVGMLDFQDAVTGRSAYDLVSLLEDARRDVSASVQQRSLDAFIASSGANRESFMAEFASFGAQRNAKILGIFARLCLRDGKPRYLSLIPRVWAHFMRDLTHPLLAPVKAWCDRVISEEERSMITGETLIQRAEHAGA